MAAGSTYIFTAPVNPTAKQSEHKALPAITGNITIEGNGATIMRSSTSPFRTTGCPH